MSDKYQSFNGFKFTRDDKTGYYQNCKLKTRIHRYVWAFYNGEIPKGYHIHHKDHDKSNNQIENLEAMTYNKHISMHGLERATKHYEEMCENLTLKARPKASEWHGSEEGLAWHGKHYEEFKDVLHMKKEYICRNCDKTFLSIRSGFCSNKCKSAWRRKEGLDNETRICIQCEKEFIVNKYSEAKCCSHSCSNRYWPRKSQLRKSKEC